MRRPGTGTRTAIPSSGAAAGATSPAAAPAGPCSQRWRELGGCTTKLVGYLLKCVQQWQERCLVLGYNLPFDLSRISVDWRYTAPQVDDFYRGGFSFAIARRPDGRVSGQHPRIEIKALQKGAAMRWTRYKQGRRGGVPARYRSVSNFL